MARKAGREFETEQNPPDTNVLITWPETVGTPPVKTTWSRIKALLAEIFATQEYVDETFATISYVNATVGAIPNPIVPIIIPVANQSSALTAGTGKFTFRLPYAFTLTEIPRASLKTAQGSGSILTFDIKVGGVSILSTLLTIDNGEKTSITAATPAALSTTSLANDAEVVIDVPQIGNGTAIGPVVTLIGRKT